MQMTCQGSFHGTSTNLIPWPLDHKADTSLCCHATYTFLFCCWLTQVVLDKGPLNWLLLLLYDYYNAQKWLEKILTEYDLFHLTLNANFSKKWLMPLGYKTSYLDPESMSTKLQNSQHTRHQHIYHNCTSNCVLTKLVRSSQHSENVLRTMMAMFLWLVTLTFGTKINGF